LNRRQGREPEERCERAELRVLIVERDAHRRLGHYPVRFASLARLFVELGCDVDVLTQQGWAFADVESDVPFRVHRYGQAVGWLDRAARTARTSTRDRAYRRRSRWARKGAQFVEYVADVCSSALAAIAVRQWTRVNDAPDLVFVLTYSSVPTVFAALVGDVPLLVYVFTPPLQRLQRIDDAIRRRPSRLERLHVATGNAALARAWAERLPDVPVEVRQITGMQPAGDFEERHADRRRARERLGLPGDARVFLLFGAGHAQQRPEVVERAFRRHELADVRLVVGGTISDRLHAPDEVAALVVPGYVSNEQRNELFAAADAIVLSFRDGYERESGSFADAVSHGLPVVVSRGCLAADVAERLGIGVVFEPDDEDSLVDAIRRVPARLDDAIVERALSELAESSVARRLLEVVSTDSDST